MENEKDRSINLFWNSVYPGSNYEKVMKQKIQRLSRKADYVTKVVIIEKGLAFIFINNEACIGFITLLGNIENEEEFNSWVFEIWQRITFKIETSEQLGELVLLTRKETLAFPVFDAEFFDETRLKDDETSVTIEYQSFVSFSSILWNLFSARPWLLLFLKEISINQEEMTIDLVYETDSLFIIKSSELVFIENVMRMENSEYRYLLRPIIINCFEQHFHEKEIKFFEYISFIHDYLEITEEKPLLIFLTKNIPIALELNRDFFTEKIEEVVTGIETENVIASGNFIEILLDLSNVLYKENFSITARLAEGKAFGLTLKVTDVEVRGELLQRMSKQVARWGVQHTIGFLKIVQSFTGDSDYETKVFKEVLENITPVLKSNIEGIETLIDANLQLGEVDKAVENKFRIAFENQDLSVRSFEVFEILAWITKHKAISNGKVSENVAKHLPMALKNAVSDEFLLEKIPELILILIQREDIEIVQATLVSIFQNIEFIKKKGIILNAILEIFSTRPQFSFQAATVLTEHFKIQLVQNNLEKAEEIFEKIYSNELYKFQETIDLSRKIVLIAAQTNYLAFLPETVQQIESKFKDKQILAKNLNSIISIFVEAIEPATSHPEVVGTQSHIISILYAIILDFAMFQDENEFVEVYFMDAINLAFSKHDYVNYVKFHLEFFASKLETGHDWKSDIIRAAKSLINLNQIKSVSTLFDGVMQKKLSDLDLTVILEAQLDLADKFTNQFLTAEQKKNYRTKLLILTEDSEDKSTIKSHFKKGFYELIENKEYANAVTTLLKAIKVFQNPNDNKDSEDFFDDLARTLYSTLNKINKQENSINRSVSLVFQVTREIISIFKPSQSHILKIAEISCIFLCENNKQVAARQLAKEALYSLDFSENLPPESWKPVEELIQVVQGKEKVKKTEFLSVLANFDFQLEVYQIVGSNFPISNLFKKIRLNAWKKVGKNKVLLEFYLLQIIFYSHANNVIKFAEKDFKKFKKEVIDVLSSMISEVKKKTPLRKLVEETRNYTKQNLDSGLKRIYNNTERFFEYLTEYEKKFEQR